VERTAENFRTRVSSWSDLADLVDHFSFFNGHDWLFRGVTNATHGLVPKIGRTNTRALKPDPLTGERARVPYRLEDERAVLAMFKQQARAHLPLAPDTELEWLAIAQHFGLPTRLLDWTDSLLVAAWFAVAKGGVEHGKPKVVDSAIWVTRQVVSVSLDYTGDPLTIGDPSAYRPPHISSRIAAQGSVLMICPMPTEEPVLPFSKKVVVDRSAEFTTKKRLSACGINTRHLFPDLAGLSEHLAWMYKNDWLAGYRQSGAPTLSPSSDDAPDEATE